MSGFWINPWWRETHWLDSVRTPDECRALLIAATGRNLWWGKGFVRSQLPGSEAIVLWRRTPWLHNSFRTVAAVRCEPGGHGAVMRVTLRSINFVAGFLTFWLGGVLFFNLVILFQVITGRISAEVLPFPLFMLAFGFGLLAFGRAITRSDGPALLDFIRQTTGAHDLAPELQSSQ